jgi:excisionase family DNA binding protein
VTDILLDLVAELERDPALAARFREALKLGSSPEDWPSRLLTVGETAEYLRVSPRTVRRRIASRSLPAVIEHDRTMIRGDDLRDYIERLDRVGAARPRPRGRRTSPDYDFLRD